MEVPVLTQSDFQQASAHRLRRLIDLLGITQVEAARIMGITKHVLRNWLAAENPIQPYPLYRLCRAKGLDFNYVMLGDWSNLPHHLARELEREALSNLAAPAAADR